MRRESSRRVPTRVVQRLYWERWGRSFHVFLSCSRWQPNKSGSKAKIYEKRSVLSSFSISQNLL